MRLIKSRNIAPPHAKDPESTVKISIFPDAAICCLACGAEYCKKIPKREKLCCLKKKTSVLKIT
jgi:tRNA(Ser,Leu) C12 N-acetylase TAN1